MAKQRFEVLLIVSHPDDDAIFAGELQRRQSAYRWRVVCLTYRSHDARAREMIAWQAHLGNDRANVTFLGLPDDPEDYRQRRCSICRHEVVARLNALQLAPDIVLTHNKFGEYGHPHHVMLHQVVCQLFRDRPLWFFGRGAARSDLALNCQAKWDAVKRTYASQRHVIEKFECPRETFVRGPGIRHQLAAAADPRLVATHS